MYCIRINHKTIIIRKLRIIRVSQRYLIRHLKSTLRSYVLFMELDKSLLKIIGDAVLVIEDQYSNGSAYFKPQLF